MTLFEKKLSTGLLYMKFLRAFRSPVWLAVSVMPYI